MFELQFTPEAESQLLILRSNKSTQKQVKAVHKALGYLQTNPKHPSLNTHEYHTLTKAHGIKVFEAYAENHTPGAYRIFWHYGPEHATITIIAITPHP